MFMMRYRLGVYELYRLEYLLEPKFEVAHLSNKVQQDRPSSYGQGISSRKRTPLKVTHGYEQTLHLRVYESPDTTRKERVEFTEHLDSKGPAELEAETTSSVCIAVAPISEHEVAEYVERHRTRFEDFRQKYFKESGYTPRQVVLKKAGLHQSELVLDTVRVLIAYLLTTSALGNHDHQGHPSTGMIQEPKSVLYCLGVLSPSVCLAVKDALATWWRRRLGEVLGVLGTKPWELATEEHFLVIALLAIMLECVMFDLHYHETEDQEIKAEEICGVILTQFKSLDSRRAVTRVCERGSFWLSRMKPWSYNRKDDDCFTNLLLYLVRAPSWSTRMQMIVGEGVCLMKALRKRLS